MKNTFKQTLISLIAGIMVAGGVILAGSLTPTTGTPEATYVSLNDIYDKLTTGATTTEKSFIPTVGTDTPTMHTLSEIFDLIYSSTTMATVDTDFTADNIKDDTDIFGIEGSYSCPSCPDGGLPKTGQTTSYVDYDDGYYEAGNPVDPRFTDNSDNTITDNATGLDWIKNPAIVSGTGFDFSGQYAWSALGDTPALNAIVALNTAGYGGHSDWRLPNVKELHSILDYETYNPSIDPIFSVATELYYWSSTTKDSGSNDAWAVDFYDGYVTATAKGNTYTIRPVRGGI